MGKSDYLPGLLEPTAPYVRPILEIHRGPDGWVTFHRKREDRLENLGSLPTSSLETMFPEFAAELERDSYFSVNSFFRAERFGNSLPGLKPAYRKAGGARYLNACFVDIDFHAQPAPFDFGYRFGRIVTLQDQEVIPPASLVMRSGRGLWLFWLLVNPQNLAIPPRAFPEQVLAYNAVQAELIRRTGADRAASDIARITRVPGSINSNIFPGDPPRVMMWTQRGSDGRGYMYTLENLVGFLGLEFYEKRRNTKNADPRPEASERGLRGWRALWQQRFEDFESLRRMRGAFSQGCRNRAAYIYGVILRGNGLNDAAVSKAVTILGGECRSPLTQREIKGAIEQSKESRRRLSDSTIAGYLHVTPEEARTIPRWADSGPIQAVGPIDMNLTNAARIALRIQAIAAIVESIGRTPSTRQMAKLLQQRGIHTSHVQVSRDYARMQMTSAEVRPLLFPVTDVTLVGRGDRAGVVEEDFCLNRRGLSEWMVTQGSNSRREA